MTNQHSITPPPELVQQWLGTYFGTTLTGEVSDVELVIAAQAAQWGADQELEACCEWLDEACLFLDGRCLRAARRPKPPSLKEQALNGLEKVESFTLGQLSGVSVFDEYKTHVDNIRRALETLND